MLKLLTIYNNNAVLVDDHGTECVVIGNGVGFGIKDKGVIDASKIDKKYVLDAEFTQNKFGALMDDIDERHVILTTKIIKEAEKDLSRVFDSSIYLFLADHISYAIKRNRNGEALKNDLLWEIKKYYPREFQAAKKSVQFIERSEKLQLDEDEAGFITLHFVNASTGSKYKNETVFTTKLISEILQIVEYYFGIKLDESSINYDRFLTHIRFFVSRVFSQEKQALEEAQLLEQIKLVYPKAYECGLKIKKHIAGQYGIKLSDSELLYFVIHINRVTSREKR